MNITKSKSSTYENLDFLSGMIKEAIVNFKGNISPADGSVKINIKREYIKEGAINLECDILLNKNVIHSYKISARDEFFPFFLVEVVKIVLISYWSGAKIKKQDKNRFIFLQQYGDKNKFYLNKNLKRIYHFKKILRLKLKN